MTFKQKIFKHYSSQLQGKIDELQSKMDELAESLKNETKSTAGDKHETSRAFVHIEQAQTGSQLTELLEQKASLTAISIDTISEKVIKGSLVKTDNAYFFISIAQGKIIVDGKTVFALSPVSPLGKKMMGASVGDELEMNGKIYKVDEIS